MMRVLVAGAVHMKGTSKKTGNDFNFGLVHVLVPVETQGPVADGGGYEPVAYNCQPRAIDDVNKHRDILPAWFEAGIEGNRVGRLTITSLEPEG